ncbi:MAG: dTMP kinase [bacterium]|nr:dTMP kinase [bacterium]
MHPECKIISTGRLLVFEGIDGAGKTTQLQFSAQWLRESGYQVTTLREPTDGPYGQKLRQSAISGRLSPEDERDLFVLDRRWNVETNITPALARGDIVLLDRYYFSSIAYQGARGLDLEDIRRRNEAVAPAPDLVLIFDLVPEIAVLRIRQTRGEELNLFEKVDYLKRVRDIFLSLSDPFIVLVDASQSEKAVLDEVKTAIVKVLPPQ